MKQLLSVFTLCTALMSGNVLAHADHGVISGQGALKVAAKSLNQMTFKDFGFEVGKLEGTWKDLPEAQLSIVSFEGNYYVVSAVNPTTQKQVFLKIASNGELLEVKDTNKF
ncbi:MULTISPECIES: DUF6488 family protein [Gammaproteobacteria]|uniref:PepSY domain-containing protein n=2 Tax=Shewanella decolorationis TaxID=256839 RepID=A0A5B8R2S5_9GAMM|nr:MULTISPECIES: DUF6488 family protein [Gammaproteobacteria]QXN27346.1 hypothetical protein KVP08_021850 [Shewanella putrefaciens]MDH0451063.1 DUF6488 family protein [Shewanella sp. GD04112]MDH1472759.1 DUF6488 family protein [Shewanella sp. GD03713]NMT49926.1 hypothetical protein [Providencia stuartii]QDZ92762.1 hypothetical protein D0436_21115 [Shewanella decolorationis]